MRYDDEVNIMCSYDDIDCRLCKAEEKFLISKIKKKLQESQNFN